MASVLLYTAPCFVMVIVAFFIFHEKMSMQKGLALLLSLRMYPCGRRDRKGSEISRHGSSYRAGFGIWLCIVHDFWQICVKRYHPITINCLTFIVAAIGILPFCKVGEMITIASGNSDMLQKRA